MATLSVSTPPGHRVVVAVGDMSVSADPHITLSTYALGSCVAIVVYDASARAGGLLHLMLPDSAIAPEKAKSQPAMFADTGLPLLFRALAGLKTDPAHLQLFVAGGASMLCTADTFKIGERNVRAVVEFLAAHGFPVRHTSVGGTINRTVHFNVGTGEITLKTPTANEKLTLAA
jgi:chemotaxis protein CheD